MGFFDLQQEGRSNQLQVKLPLFAGEPDVEVVEEPTLAPDVGLMDIVAGRVDVEIAEPGEEREPDDIAEPVVQVVEVDELAGRDVEDV